jgi:hypothetical protein
MTHAKSVESGSASDAGLEAAFMPAESGRTLRVAQECKGASPNVPCAEWFGRSELTEQVPGVEYENIVSEKKVALANILEWIILANREDVRYKVEEGRIPAQLSSSWKTVPHVVFHIMTFSAPYDPQNFHHFVVSSFHFVALWTVLGMALWMELVMELVMAPEKVL